LKFYSGFSLCKEKNLFEAYIKISEYTVCGFSYGAIKAFKHVKQELDNSNRVDTLQLFSPAFFQTKSDKFKRLQTLSYTKHKEKYLSEFINGCFYPYKHKNIQHSQTSLAELEELLYYEWNLDELKYLEDKGVRIEVYLGGEDKIIDLSSAQELFLEVATVTYIKSANHFLQIN
jgi:hypothetical protein